MLGLFENPYVDVERAKAVGANPKNVEFAHKVVVKAVTNSKMKIKYFRSIKTKSKN